MRIFAVVAVALAGMGAANGQVLEEPEKRALQARIAELRTQAKELRKAAEDRQAAAHAACWKKFLVTACQDDAKKALQAEKAEARRIEAEARAIERDIRRREAEAREARRIEEAPAREEAAAKRAEKNRREQEAAMRRVEERQAEAEARESRAQEGSMRQ